MNQTENFYWVLWPEGWEPSQLVNEKWFRIGQEVAFNPKYTKTQGPIKIGEKLEIPK